MPDEETVVPPEGAEETPETPEEPPRGEDEGEETGETEEAPPEPRKKTAQERIDEITAKRREAEREAAYWRKLALDKEKAEAKEPEQPRSEGPAMPPRPRLDQYDTTAEYEDALLEWHDTRREVAGRAARQKTEEQAAFQTFQEKAKAFRAEHEDFDEVIESPVFSEAMRSTILHSENGPQLAYHLGRPENRAVAEKILSLPPERQTYEIGKLETQLVIAAKTRKPTGAPPPITPLGMSGGGAGEIDESKLSDDEWYALEKKRHADKIKKKFGG